MAGRLSKLISTAEQSDIIETDDTREIPTSRLGILKAVIAGKDSRGKTKLLKIMALSLLGAVGAAMGICFFLIMSANISSLGSASMASSNIGIGGQFSIGVGKAFDLAVLDLKFMFYLILFPSLLVFGVFLSGLFHVAKKWAYLEKEPVYNDKTMAALFFKPIGRFFKPFLIGIKKNVFNFLVIFLLLGGVLFLFNLALKGITTAQIYNGNNAGLIIATIFLCIFLGFYLIMTMYMCTLSATYKMNIFIVIKNAALLTVGSLNLVLRNILVTALCFAPAALFWFSGLGVIGLIFFAAFGIMLSIIGFTVYSHWVFEKVGLDRSSVSYSSVIANAGSIDKKTNVIESEFKAENVESSGENDFSPTANTQTQKKNNQPHSNKKKKKH